ncbi:hypothetical protein MTO96_029092 [Rhipicephalus appendiculatus]
MALLFYTLYGFAIIFFAGWWFVWLLHLLAIFNGKMKLHKKKALPPLEVPLPGVSIIKPLTGGGSKPLQQPRVILHYELSTDKSGKRDMFENNGKHGHVVLGSAHTAGKDSEIARRGFGEGGEVLSALRAEIVAACCR